MRLHTFLGRFALSLALVGLASIGSALPAQADPEEERAEVEVFVPDRIVTLDGKAKTVEFQVFNVGGVPAEGVRVEFTDDDGSPIPASVGFTAPEGCAPDGCDVGELAVGARKSYKFQVRPTADLPELGETVTVSARDGSGESVSLAHVSVLRAEAGVDLEVGTIEDMKVAPGKSATVPVVVRNAGNRPVEGLAVILAGAPFLSFASTYSNCVKVDELFGVACVFEQTLGADEVFTLSAATPMRVKVAANAPGPGEYFAGAIATGLDEDSDLALLAARERASTAKAPLKLVPVNQRRSSAAEGELNDWDNIASFFVKVSKNPADNVAVGATFTGAVGDTRTVKVGVRNDGPAAMLGPLQGWISFSKVRIPAGVELTKVDRDCMAVVDGKPVGDDGGEVHGRDYVCIAIENLGKGEQAVFSFTGTITGASSAGSVTVDGGEQDSKKSNDVAQIAVQLTAGGSGGGLPVTGAPAGLLAGGGALLLAAGAAAFVIARRRRIVTVAE
ncbi:hypothetical protein AB0J80_11375 [Actinoplanes sp. NPDC049548]|uniref:hypothetical protein n=1 Tax=Actinoplanes sp. NPDC049548 TaxID=3155152 RepID=UPI003414FD00